MPIKISLAKVGAKLCIVGALFALLNAAVLIVGDHPTRSWPSVRGEVEEVTFSGIISPGGSYRGAGGGGVLRRFRVAYHFEIEGRRYIGVDDLPQRPGKTVEVYYQPGKPQVSGLKQGVDVLAVAASLAIAFFLWICSIAFGGAARAA